MATSFSATAAMQRRTKRNARCGDCSMVQSSKMMTVVSLGEDGYVVSAEGNQWSGMRHAAPPRAAQFEGMHIEMEAAIPNELKPTNILMLTGEGSHGHVPSWLCSGGCRL